MLGKLLNEVQEPKKDGGLRSRMLDSRSLQDYLRLKSRYKDSRLIPRGANNVKVSNIKELSGNVTNDVYSFSLTFTNGGLEHRFDLILKAYTMNLGLWFKIYRPDEDVRPYVREFQALKCLERANFPVPPAYICECDPFFLGYPFVVMRKEKVTDESINRVGCFAETLARLHNLKVDRLEIESLRFPKNDSAFAWEWTICLKHFLDETRHYRSLKRDFNRALRWLESNVENNRCPQYCLLHGEYHPGHALITNENGLEVIDWEGIQIGDPAFDVGYAYHMVKLMVNRKNPNSGEKAAEQFVSEYTRNFQGDIDGRLEFYKVIGILGLSIEISSWVSSPLVAYGLFGHETLARALAFPFLRSRFLIKKWLNEDFFISCLQYCQDFIETTL